MRLFNKPRAIVCTSAVTRCTAQSRPLAEQEATACIPIPKCWPCAPGLLHREQGTLHDAGGAGGGRARIPNPEQLPATRQGVYTVYSATFATSAEQEAAACALPT